MLYSIILDKLINMKYRR